MSVDLDLFSNKSFENADVIEALQNEFHDSFVVEDKPARFGIFCYVDEVKIDIVRHPHPLIRPRFEIEGIGRRYCCHESAGYFGKS